MEETITLIKRLFRKDILIYTHKETNYNNTLYLVVFTLAKLEGLANYKIMIIDCRLNSIVSTLSIPYLMTLLSPNKTCF